VTTAKPADDLKLLEQLGAPFAPGCVGWKPGATNQNKTKAIALAYIDARDVMDRLDTVLGPGGWRDEYEPLTAGAVRCRLWLRVGGEWVAKEDVGGASAQPDAGDKAKAAFSDALKRAAVKWGVGRYLYHLDAAWCEYDAQRKQFRGLPKLPPWALPGGTGRPPTYSPPPYLAAELDDDPPPRPSPPAREPGDDTADVVAEWTDAIRRCQTADQLELLAADAGQDPALRAAAKRDQNAVRRAFATAREMFAA